VHVRQRRGSSSELLIVKGNPSFTRLRRISFGVFNPTTTTTYASGQLWFNELRAIDVAKDRGQAQRINLVGQMSNLFSYSFVWDGRSADFLSVGETRGSGNSRNDLSAGTTFNLHRFFEGTGISLPITFGWQRNLSQPRFNAGDDVVRSGAQSEASETSVQSQNWSTSYSRNWSERAHPLLRYTLGGITANMSRASAQDHNPNALGKRWSTASTVDYRVAPRRLLSIQLPWIKSKFTPLPEQFYWKYDVGQSWSQTTDRIGLTGDLRKRDAVEGRTAGVVFGATTRPFESFTHKFDGVRNLMLASPQQLGFLHFGKVVSWNQSMNTQYSLKRGNWINPVINWSSNYGQDNGPQLSPDLSVRAVRNGQTMNVSWGLPFDRLAPAAAPAAAGDTTRKVAKSMIRDLLSRLGAISTDANFNWSSSYSRLRGTPSFLYLLGLSQESGPRGLNGRVTRDFGNVSSRGFDWRTGARTRLALFLGSSVSTSADFSSATGNQNNVQSRRDQARFPDLSVDYGRVVNAIGLAKIMQNPRLQTSFNRSLVTEFNAGRESSRLYTSEWRPALSLKGELKNGTRIDLTVNRRVTRNIRKQLGLSTTTDRSGDVSLSVNRSYSQGQKVSLLGRETTVKSTVNLGLTANYERQSGETLQEGSSLKQLPKLQDRLSMNFNGSYGFSNNVTGNASLGFGQNRNMLSGSKDRNVRVELRAAFTF
jgi:hypothetical protein